MIEPHLSEKTQMKMFRKTSRFSSHRTIINFLLKDMKQSSIQMNRAIGTFRFLLIHFEPKISCFKDTMWYTDTRSFLNFLNEVSQKTWDSLEDSEKKTLTEERNSLPLRCWTLHVWDPIFPRRKSRQWQGLEHLMRMAAESLHSAIEAEKFWSLNSPTWNLPMHLSFICWHFIFQWELDNVLDKCQFICDWIGQGIPVQGHIAINLSNASSGISYWCSTATLWIFREWRKCFLWLILSHILLSLHLTKFTIASRFYTSDMKLWIFIRPFIMSTVGADRPFKVTSEED